MGPLAHFGLDGYPWTGHYLRFTLLSAGGGGAGFLSPGRFDPHIHQQNQTLWKFGHDLDSVCFEVCW